MENERKFKNYKEKQHFYEYLSKRTKTLHVSITPKTRGVTYRKPKPIPQPNK